MAEKNGNRQCHCQYMKIINLHFRLSTTVFYFHRYSCDTYSTKNKNQWHCKKTFIRHVIPTTIWPSLHFIVLLTMIFASTLPLKTHLSMCYSSGDINKKYSNLRCRLEVVNYVYTLITFFAMKCALNWHLESPVYMSYVLRYK